MSQEPDFPINDPGPSQEPRLHCMSWKQFEKFCRDIGRGVEPGVQNAGLYEEEGKAQFGADFYLVSENESMIVGSCKAHEEPEKKDIVGAASKFADHWDTVWKNQGVTKFILCLAAPVETQTRINHVKAARLIIRDRCGIPCRVWARDELIEHCAGLPRVVQRHMGTAWKLELCDRYEPFEQETSTHWLEALSSQVEAYEASTSSLLSDAVSSILALIKRGQLTEAAERARSIQQDFGQWKLAEPAQKAQLIRVQAAHVLETDPEGAETLYREAATHETPKDRYFDVLTTHRREGVDAASQLLVPPLTDRERVLQGALLVETGATEKALKLLRDNCENQKDEADRFRYCAFAYLSQRNPGAALDAAEAALAIDPESWSAKVMRATCCYATSLSPANGAPGIGWPTPYPTSFTLQTSNARASRRRAIDLFQDLQSTAPSDLVRAQLGVWRFAALLDDPRTRQDAADYIQASFDNNLFHHGLVMWSIMRRVEFDHEKAQASLERMVQGATPPPDAISTLLWLLMENGQQTTGLSLVDQHEDDLKQIHPEAPDVWRRRLTGSADGPEQEAFTNIDSKPTQTYVTLLNSQDASPHARLEAANVLADRAEWSSIWAARDYLLTQIASPEALWVTALSAANTMRPQEALDWISKQAETLTSGYYPDELSELTIQLKADSGDIRGAIVDADSQFTDPSKSHFLKRAYLRVQSGDLSGASKHALLAFEAGNPALEEPTTAINLIRALKTVDPAFSSDLLRRAAEKDIPPELAGPAVSLALELIPDGAGPFVEAMQAVAGRKDGPVQLATLDEIKEMMSERAAKRAEQIDLYQRGEVFSHGIFEDRLGLAFLAPVLRDRTFINASPLISHAVGGTRDTPFSKILMDLTSILTAEALELWPLLEAARFQITLPENWSAALLTMREAAAPNQLDYATAYQNVVETLERKRLKVVATRPAGSVYILHSGDLGEGEDVSLEQVSDLLNTLQADDRRRALHLSGGVAVELARLGQLDALVNLARVSISEWDERVIRTECEDIGIGTLVSSRLDRLRERLSRCVTSGVVLVASTLTRDPDLFGSNQIYYALRNVMGQQPQQGLAVAIDDRYFNGFDSLADKPVVSIRALMRRLVTDGQLSQEDEVERLNLLRECSYSHLPPNAAETMAALESALSNEAGGERRLLSLQRAFGSVALTHSDMLARPPENGVNEYNAAYKAFLLASHVLRFLLVNGFNSIEKDEQAMLWVFDAYRLDWRENLSEQGAAAVMAGWHGGILFAFLAVAYELEEDQTNRARKLLWTLYENKVLKTLEPYPEVLKDVHEHLATSVRHYLEKERGEDEEMEQIRIAMVLRFIDILPRSLKDILFSHKDIAEKFGVRSGTTIAEHFLPEKRLWLALDDLAHGGASAKLETNNDLSFDVTLDDTGDIVLSTPEETIRLKVAVPGVFSPDKAKRLKSFAEFLDNVGLAKSEKTHWRRRFGNARSSETREALVRDVGETTIRGKAWRLTQFVDGDQVSVEQLEPPSLALLQKWLGIDDKTNLDFKVAFEAIAEAHGTEEAILRWLGAPVPLPESAIEWFSTLESKRAIDVLQRLVSVSAGPVAHRNLFDLCTERGDIGSPRDEFVQDMLSHLPARADACRLFSKAGQAKLLAGAQSKDELIVGSLCAWVWAEQVIAALASVGANIEQLSEFVVEQGSGGRASLLQTMSIHDRLDASRITTPQLVASVADKFHDLKGLWVEDPATILAPSLLKDDEGVFPHVSLLSFCAKPNHADTWFGPSLGWVIDLFPVTDKLATATLKGADELRKSLWAESHIDFVTLCIVGVGQPSKPEIDHILKEVKRQIPRAHARLLFYSAKLLSDLNGLSPIQCRRRAALLSAAIVRHLELDDDDGTTPFNFLEIAFRSFLADEPSLAWKRIEEFLRLMLRTGGVQVSEAVCDFSAILRDISPLTERARFGVIYAQASTALPSVG